MQKEEGTTRKRSKYKTWLIIPDEELFRAMVKPKTGEPWTKTEDAILRKNFWLPFEELKVLLPGRSKGGNHQADVRAPFEKAGTGNSPPRNGM